MDIVYDHLWHEKFAFALDSANCDIEKNCKNRHGIGRMSERTLHAFLKYYFEPDNAFHEKKVGTFIADIAHESKITEIQTRGFNKLRKKLDFFLPDHEVTVVYPIASTKWLCWIDNATGEVTKKRKSPKKGSIFDFLHELYKIRLYLDKPNLRLCVIMMDIVEYRNLDGWSKNKKKGSSRSERIPLSVNDMIYIENLFDYNHLIPNALPPVFDSNDFAKKAKITRGSAQTALNILNYVGAVKRCGKIANAFLYEKNI